MTQAFRLRWTAELPAPLFGSPVAAPVVLAPGTFELGGLDAATGATRWRLPAGVEPRSFAWALWSPAGPVACTGMDRLWRITGLDPAGKSRFSLLLEGWGSEAVVLGDCTYVLYTREGEHSGLWELDGAGELRRRWQVPAGGFSLSASGGQLCFAVRAAAQEGLYQVELEGGGLRRLATGKVERVECSGNYILLQRAGGEIELRDVEGGLRWEAKGGGLTPHLDGDGLFGAEEEGGEWGAVCRDLATGALRWRHPLPDAGRYLEVCAWEDTVVAWDAGPLTLLDRQSGALIQAVEGDFTALGPAGCGKGYLVAAAGEQIHCIERS